VTTVGTDCLESTELVLWVNGSEMVTIVIIAGDCTTADELFETFGSGRVAIVGRDDALALDV
jgi:hypothetical protein